jgi:broad specificity phosphatase PhoE
MESGCLNIEQLLQLYSENGKISLLIRHADRFDIPAGTEDKGILLTDKGITNAIQFGRRLSDCQINKIITTPVKRCIQTAEYIASGYGKEIKIEPSKTFGGLHIRDWQIAGEWLKKNGYEEWYRNIINGLSAPGIYDAGQYKESMTNFLVENTKTSGLTIFISHDFLIAFYQYAVNKITYTMFTDWVNYLSGLILKNGNYVDRFQND